MSQISTPYRGILNAENPNSSIQTSYPTSAPQRPLQDILDENEHLRITIDKLKKQREESEKKVNQVNEPQAPKQQFKRRVEQNAQRLRQLNSVVESQEKVIQTYREKLQDFQDNLIKVMKLDKDIHQRLVNPQPNNTLQTNVRNVLVALNGRAPYDRLIKMIESIRV